MESKDVVVKQQYEIEIYANESGQIVIKSKSFPDGDVFIVFDAIHAGAIASAIKRIAVQLSTDGLNKVGGA